MSLEAGNVHWAIVPYTPAAPFEIHVRDGAPVEVPSARQIIDGLRRGGDAEFKFVVRAKARPILLLSGRSDPLTGDLFGLRLMRLSKLAPREREKVEAHHDPALHPLPPGEFPGLEDRSAVMVTAPIRVHESAVDTRQSLGRLGRDELRTLTERFTSYWDFDLRQLLIAQIREIQRRRG